MAGKRSDQTTASKAEVKPGQRAPLNSIIQHSSEDMREIPDGAVALTVTSPPYWNAIDYGKHSEDKSQFYRTRGYSEGFIEYDEYLAWLGRIFGEVLRATKPGGFCCVVIGTVLFNHRHYAVPMDLVSQMTRSGWEFHQDIIWHKCTAGVKRAGVSIQKPHPGYFYPNIMTEYILVFRKPGEAIYKDRSKAEYEGSKYPINRLFTMDIANNVWHIAPVPPDLLDHPCPFPEEIPFRLISLYSYKGELVLDPFNGSGQTTKVARWTDREFLGYETIKRYVDLGRRRLEEPLAIRPEQLIAVFDKVGLGDPAANEGIRKGSRARNGRKPRSPGGYRLDRF